jgi:kinesin family protein 11
MSRNALLKDYVGEIERLKADLVSAREKNGMYLSNESWDQISAEKEQLQVDCEAAKRWSDTISAQLKALREEFDHSMLLLKNKERELVQTQASYEEQTQVLHRCERNLNTVKIELQEEKLVREAYRQSEKNIDGIAKTLKLTVSQTIGDLDGMFQKLGE